jgi:hypothetical protein
MPKNLSKLRRISQGREMANEYNTETVIQSISETRSAASQNADQLDLEGLSLLRLLDKAVELAEANDRQAMETAQELSAQLRAAKDQIAELEAEVQLYREKERAEQWLSTISGKIKERLIKRQGG